MKQYYATFSWLVDVVKGNIIEMGRSPDSEVRSSPFEGLRSPEAEVPQNLRDFTSLLLKIPRLKLNNILRTRLKPKKWTSTKSYEAYYLFHTFQWL